MHKLPMIRSLRAAVVLSVLMILPLFVTVGDPLTAVYGIALTVMAAPVLLPFTALCGGLLPAVAGWIAAILMAWIPFGTGAGLQMALFLLPAAAAFLICVSRDVPFFRTALWMILGEMAGGFAVLLMMNYRADGMLAQQMAEQFAQLIVDSGNQDELLLAMLSTGFARLDQSLYSQASGLMGGLSELGREELLLSLKTTLTDLLSLLPALLVSNSIQQNLAGLGLGIYFGRRSVIRSVVDRRRNEVIQQVMEQRKKQLATGEVAATVRLESREQMIQELNGDCEQALEGFPTLQMPPFSLWHMPRGVGLMAALPAVGYLLALLSDAPQAQLVGNMLGGIFSALYTIQGVAAMDYIMGRANRNLVMRCAVLAIGMLLVPRVFLFIGISDQIFNIRNLRKPLGEGRQEM